MALLLRSSCPPICSAVPAVLFNRRRLAYAAPQSSLSAGDMARSSGAEFFQDDTRPIMLFDGVCNLCNGGVRFVRENDRNRFGSVLISLFLHTYQPTLMYLHI
ncbi:uncharacterized protein LOC110037516 [Phalaenopsis equestris]|uniref:uncharacterized protein LOC110037516 n=1 Tax=Phalaenopsis equestris TaxID=78828 RepID=UPI0009E33AC8|nr:uncharacterized protein LOC110037516 [Phalaenopsis equestris]